MLEEHSLSTGVGSLNYARGPHNGPPLILFHGVTRCWQDWSILLPDLMMNWQVFALDFRGHGRSCDMPGKYHVIDYADDGRATEILCYEPPVIYGHSLGAMVALATAGDTEYKIRALILEDPPFETMGHRIKETSFHSLFTGMQQLLQTKKTVPELTRGLAEIRITTPGSDATVRLGDVRDATSLRFSARCLSCLDPDVLTSIVAGEWLKGYDLGAILAKIHCPVLLLQADTSAGGMLADEDADKMEATLSECYRVRFPGAGHLLHWMEREKLLRLVRGFLESL